MHVYYSGKTNFITRWLAAYRGVNGTLDDDLIGEASVVPSCASTMPATTARSWLMNR